MNYDYLKVEQTDKEILGNLSKMCEHLKQLRLKQEETALQAEIAKKEYEHYANVVIPQEMFSAGVEGITLKSGGVVSIKKNFYCQPNKNVEDRKIIVEWLNKFGGGHLVEHEATVSGDNLKDLKEHNVPFVENTAVNTNKLKSFIKDGLGITDGKKKFDIEDIPACVHFQEVSVAEISMPK